MRNLFETSPLAMDGGNEISEICGEIILEKLDRRVAMGTPLAKALDEIIRIEPIATDLLGQKMTFDEMLSIHSRKIATYGPQTSDERIRSVRLARMIVKDTLEGIARSKGKNAELLANGIKAEKEKRVIILEDGCDPFFPFIVSIHDVGFVNHGGAAPMILRTRVKTRSEGLSWGRRWAATLEACHR